ncbi:uncharacterized protein RJT20DRAFT_140905 [Scheffersomyces xylosifermentans]|uniref:uncharacterized protein n=1 Tax=Scheffersomyces xylosifermentans TaxID=1304137 RepID=UPI00315C6141
MKFSTTILTAIAYATFVAAAPAPAGTDVDIPEKAISAVVPLSDDLVPIVTEYEGHQVVLIVNATEATSPVTKRDANAEPGWHLTSYGSFEPRKRDAIASPGWHLTSYGSFEPRKRDANAEPGWHLTSYGSFEPRKRDADWHWTSYGAFEPRKRDADWHWTSYGAFEPRK